MHPRYKAQELLSRFDRQLRYLATELPIDCQCADHIGPHAVHLSRTILLSNFQVLLDHIDHAVVNEATSGLINALLDVLEAEAHRQIDLMSELPMLSSRYWNSVLNERTRT